MCQDDADKLRAQDADWHAKAIGKGKQIENVPIEQSPYLEEPVYQRLRCFRKLRAKRLFPEIKRVIDTKLSARQREAIILFFGLPCASKRQVGDLMSIHRSGVSRHVKKGLVVLRENIKTER